jgi:hypothetical protein
MFALVTPLYFTAVLLASSLLSSLTVTASCSVTPRKVVTACFQFFRTPEFITLSVGHK